MIHDYETMRFCVRAYLGYVRGIDATITAVGEDIARVEARLELLGVSLAPVGSGDGGRDALPDGLARAAELRDEWEGAMALYADDLACARRLCRPVHERRYALWLHLVEGRTWGEAARELGYSERHARRLADDGVRELYPLMPERWRREPIPNAAPR